MVYINQYYTPFHSFWWTCWNLFHVWLQGGPTTGLHIWRLISFAYISKTHEPITWFWHTSTSFDL